MLDLIPIDDPSDSRIADYIGLTDADLRRRVEGATLFIAEGTIVIRELLRSAYPVRSVLLTERRLDALAADLATVDAPLYLASQSVMNEVAGFNIHRGAVAAAGRLPLPEPRLLLAGARRVAVLEGLNDHENLGALFRNAAAFGVDAILLDPTCADPLYRRSVRVSLGHVLRVPYARLEPWPSSLHILADLGFEIVALTPRQPAEDVAFLDGIGARRLAVLLGAEGTGLSAAALAAAPRWLRIPMAAGVDSLNVATAAAIAFHRAGSLPGRA